jgi:hypothetical protein
MTSVASIFNTVLTFLFGLFYGALKWLGPFWSLVALSILGGILLVWIFGKVSNQDAIKRARNRLSAELIALRLFKDDLRSLLWGSRSGAGLDAEVSPILARSDAHPHGARHDHSHSIEPALWPSSAGRSGNRPSSK